MKFVRVLNKEVQENKKNLFIYALTIALVLFVQEVGGAFFIRMTGGIQPAENGYLTNFIGFLFLGGFITTSIIFSDDMFSRIGQHNWLMLPASRLQKFLAKGLLTAIAYPIALAVLLTVVSIVVEAIALLFFGNPFIMFNPFTRHIGIMMLHYLVTQSIFLLGATYFRKTHFVKTVLSLGVIGILLAILSTIMVRIVFAPYFTGPFGFHFSIDSYVMYDHLTLVRVSKWIGSVIYWAILPAFCWYTAYLRVKEVQATDAIR
jgi:hypothetical protein